VKAGGCAGVEPLSVRKKSPLYGARIISVRGKGGAAREVVAIRNRAGKTLSFRKASLTNLKGRGFYFPNRFKLRKGRTVRVHTGCQKGKHRSTFSARAVWLCGKSGIFRDKGDLARLADSKLLVVSQRGFGSQRSRPAF
jgi:hypothetical protein